MSQKFDFLQCGDIIDLLLATSTVRTFLTEGEKYYEKRYIQITATALACVALVLVMVACGSEKPALSDTETPVATTQAEQTTTQAEQMTTQQEEQILQPEQTATSETQQWIDSLYNALIQDDAKTVVTLLGNVENVRTHCASYVYAWNNNRSDTCEGFLLTASDGTQFGVGLFAENGYQYIEAFVSVSDDEYGFHCIYAGDHYVEIVEGWGYNYLKGDEFF